jgi:hypothetical protein
MKKSGLRCSLLLALLLTLLFRLVLRVQARYLRRIRSRTKCTSPRLVAKGSRRHHLQRLDRLRLCETQTIYFPCKFLNIENVSSVCEEGETSVNFFLVSYFLRCKVIEKKEENALRIALPFSSPSFFHTISLPRVHSCVMGRLVHTDLGSSSLAAHVLHYPGPSPHANSFIIGTAIINTHRIEAGKLQHFSPLTIGKPVTCQSTD